MNNIPGNLESIRRKLRELGPHDSLIMGDVQCVEDALTALTKAAVQGEACAAQLELEFKKQGQQFFARAVANSLDTIRAGLDAVRTK